MNPSNTLGLVPAIPDLQHLAGGPVQEPAAGRGHQHHQAGGPAEQRSACWEGPADGAAGPPGTPRAPPVRGSPPSRAPSELPVSVGSAPPPLPVPGSLKFGQPSSGKPRKHTPLTLPPDMSPRPLLPLSSHTYYSAVALTGQATEVILNVLVSRRTVKRKEAKLAIMCLT